MSKADTIPASKALSDEYGNLHCLADELARGGQGVVFRTMDGDLAIKQPLDASGQPDRDANLRDRFQNIRLLPIPSRIPISMPLAILRDEPGYVMRLLSGMQPFSHFDLDGKTKKQLQEKSSELPQWIAGIPDKEMALRLLYHAVTGSTRRRLFALSKCAAILARLHCAGLVYGDVSPNNSFIGTGSSRDVWLIDADNLRFEMRGGGSSVYTPGYGAPEVVRGINSIGPRTDCWAFAVMAFKMLALCHPFIGRKVLQPDDDGGWDAEPPADGMPADLDEQAYAGYLPFVDDKDDDSNKGVGGLPRELVATPNLRLLFQETFGPGRTQPHLRPTMSFWALELAKAFDRSLECHQCKMSYFVEDSEKCPYCDAPLPAFIRARTSRWEAIIPDNSKEFAIPHRMFHPFSFEHHDDAEYEAILDGKTKTVFPARGTKTFPDSLKFTFVEAAK